MARIYLVEPIVEEALRGKPETRGDNFLLYIEVLKKFIDTNMSLDFVFRHHIALGIPSLESITRSRRKLQEKDPTLRDEKASKIRAEEELEYFDYSKE